MVGFSMHGQEICLFYTRLNVRERLPHNMVGDFQDGHVVGPCIEITD